jgi:hypothetical protein
MTAYPLRDLIRRDHAVSFTDQILEDLAGSLVEPFSAQWTFRREHFRAPKSEDAQARLLGRSYRWPGEHPLIGCLAHLEYQARTVITERCDADPQRAGIPAPSDGLKWTSLGANRLLGKAAATRTARRTTPEEIAARPSENPAPEVE